ncbi:uncharacterized protein LOC108160847 [Drosophila miranda]|uniref:uncharacterized protein LOC108160847 n=1 Tax=Drosophila miranda TaxID=7229 RepID=UPI00143FAB9E|nr:uncharacterized protein LOC108160847 [Drosophila miranda]
MHNIGILSMLFTALAVVVCLRVKEFVAMPLSIAKPNRGNFASTPVAEGKIETSTDRGRGNLSLVSNDKDESETPQEDTKDD